MAEVDWDDVWKQIPPAFVEDFVRDRLLPIVGAGFSRNAVVRDGPAPADWDGLGAALAANLGPDGAKGGDDAVDLISAFEVEFGRSRLVQAVSDLIRWGDALPGRPHEALAELRFTDFVTTNFDELLEQALRMSLGGVVRVVTDESQLGLDHDSAIPRVIKFHGDVQHPNRMVLTEEDYDSFLLRNPLLASYLAAMLVDHVGWLIGYSLDDPDLRQIQALLRDRMGNAAPRLWTIRLNDSAQTVERFRRRGVTVVNVRVELGYPEFFVALFKHLASERVKLLDAAGQGANERVQETLRSGASSRKLLLFAVPRSRLSWYDEFVFPHVDAAGLIPVTGHDLVDPDSWMERIDYLARRCLGAVVEVGSEAGEVELAVVRRFMTSKQVWIVRRSLGGRLDVLDGFDTVVATADIDAAPEFLVDGLVGWMDSLRPEPIGNLTEQAQELIDRGFVAQAFLTVWTAFETSLRDRLVMMDVASTRSSKGPLSGMRLINAAIEAHLVPDPPLWRDLVHLRNMLVHGEITLEAGAIDQIVSPMLEWMDLPPIHPPEPRSDDAST